METQGLRLQQILSELQITPYRFSKLLGYKSPDTIYHILNGKQMVSTNMQNRIRELNPEINENWILTGIGSPFIKKLIKGPCGDEQTKNGKIIYPARLMSEDIRILAKKIASEIFFNSETKDYEIRYRISGIEGLEFIFTTLNYNDENKEKYPEKHYSLIMSPEWKIISFFDFWRVNSPTRRCQNLLEITNDSRKKNIEAFETKTKEFLDELDEEYVQKNTVELSNQNFSILYTNYPCK